MDLPVVIVMGTRPEAIKLLPIYLHLKKIGINTVLCVTHQHREMLDAVLGIFQVSADYALDIMMPGQQLDYITGAVVQKTHALFKDIRPALVMVQGDTTTAFGASLAAFYQNIPIAHVEAGLRTGNKRAPFPEEINRQCITIQADLHFAPTPLNVLHLLRAGVPSDAIFCVGNTVVDALYMIRQKIQDGIITPGLLVREVVDRKTREKKQLVLLTTHRRESFDGGLESTLRAIKNFAQKFSDVLILFPIHPNPIVQTEVKKAGFDAIHNIVLTAPLSYPDLVYVLDAVNFVITDSGGIQEEAVCLGKSVIILRDFTERVESIWSGMSILAGTNQMEIERLCQELYYRSPEGKAQFVYGDGKSSERISSIITKKEYV